MLVDILPLLFTLLGSATFSSLFTYYATRHRTNAETVALSVKTALDMEERAHSRYITTADALVEAEHLLVLARKRIQELETDLTRAHRILRSLGVSPCSEELGKEEDDAE